MGGKWSKTLVDYDVQGAGMGQKQGEYRVGLAIYS